MPQWTEFGADVPRILANGWLLSEGQRTNGNRNSRFEGTTPGVIGSGGVLPTYAQATGNPQWWTVLGTGVENGLPFLDLACDATAGGSTNIWLEAANGIPLAGNATYTSSIFARVLSGSMATFGTFGFARRTDAGTPLNGPAVSLLGATGSMARYSITDTTAADATSGRCGLLVVASSAGSVALRIYAPQVEFGGFPSTPILPPVGAPGASMRGADAITRAMSALFPGGSGTVIGTMAYDNLPGTGNTFDFIQTDSGSNNDRLLLRILPTSNILRMVAVTGGTTTTADAGAPTLGAAFRWGLTWDGLGRAAACFNGASPVSLTGISAGHSNFRMLAGISLAAATFGRFGRILAMPFTIDDATHQARVAALPLT